MRATTAQERARLSLQTSIEVVVVMIDRRIVCPSSCPSCPSCPSSLLLNTVLVLVLGRGLALAPEHQ